MSFFSLLAVLLLQQLRPWRSRGLLRLAHYLKALARHFNSGEYRDGVIAWLVVCVPSLLLIWAVYYLLLAVNPLLGWAWNVAVLYLTMDLRRFGDIFIETGHALRCGDLERARRMLAGRRDASAGELPRNRIAALALEQGLISAYRQWFAVAVWFVLLPGPGGALLYRLAERLAESWDRDAAQTSSYGRFARQVLELLDWLPARLTALSFAVAGDFEDALYCWRSQAAAWRREAEGIVLASASGALGVRLGGAPQPQLGNGDAADADHLQSALGLVWRALAIWLLLLLLLTIASWVG